MSKAHRGSGIRELLRSGRGTCPVCKRSGIKVLYEHEDTGRCVAKHVYRYATGHRETEGEAEVVEDLTARFDASGYRIKALLLETAMSPGFRRAGTPR